MNPSDSISLCTGLLLPTTSKYSSASSTVIVAHFPGMGRLPRALIKSLQTTDHCTPKSAATHAFSIRTDSRFSNLEFPSLLSIFSSGTWRVLLESSRSPAPATWVTHSPWDEPTSSTTTTLSSVLTDKIFFLFKLKHVAIRLSNYHMVYIHTLSLTLILSNFDEFVCQQKHQHDISRIRWGAELKISSFHSSLPCLV